MTLLAHIDMICSLCEHLRLIVLCTYSRLWLCDVISRTYAETLKTPQTCGFYRTTVVAMHSLALVLLSGFTYISTHILLDAGQSAPALQCHILAVVSRDREGSKV